jgi:haloalkane dehalogenase
MTSMGGESRRGYLDLPWGQVHYRHGGAAGQPAVLILHQSPLSSATYEAVIAPLARRGVRTVAVDTPGYGMSDPPPRPWSIPDYADAVWQIADALGLTDLHLLGQHTGAVIAAEAALLVPGRVRGLILQGLPLYGDDERRLKRESWAPGYVPDRSGDHLGEIWERIYRLYPRITVEEADRQVIEYLSVGPDYAAGYRAVFDHQVDTARIAGIPTLLLHGSDDLVDRMTATVCAALPAAGLVTIPDGTDFVADEQPEEFAAAVAGYVNRASDPAERSPEAAEILRKARP